eukprot:jgi/Tetstr1/436138/TSEL_024985.t1
MKVHAQAGRTRARPGSSYEAAGGGPEPLPVTREAALIHRACGAQQLDLLAGKLADDKARQWHELHGYQPPRR